MSKALSGASLLAGAAIAGGVAFGLASGGSGFAALPFLNAFAQSAFLSGISMEAGAVADALTSNRGTNITTRQSAAYRQIIYGQQRVGGISIYKSTTGSHKDQFNYIIVLAGHEIDSIVNLYLDGRQVFFASGVGNSDHGGIPFGGSATGGTYTGPNGVQYNFGGLVYCEAYFGDQTDNYNTVVGGGFSTGLQANDPNWGPDANGNLPWLAGCAYVYLKLEANAGMFPGEPEIRFTINGKNNIWDPRTQTRGYTSNWALIMADVITDTQFGLGDNSVNQAQLIAAANICDEQVPIRIGGTEARYACHYHYDTSVAPGDALQAMMPAAAGRMSRIGGEWYLWPAYWQGPSFTFDHSNLTGPVEWHPYRSYRDLFNRVSGTYTAPNYPWNIAGNLYDANGFYNGQIQNNFGFAFQPTNFPQYAADVLHGYTTDEYLAQDGGRQLPKELSLQCVLSVSQAQRLAKICLLRNRQQGSGTFHMNLAAFQMQPTDVMQFTFPQNGWVEKLLEIDTVSFSISEGTPDNPPAIRAKFGVIETAASVYDWDVSEELDIYSAPNLPAQTPYIVAPPTNMTLTSSAATAIKAVDGVITPRVLVSWDAPLDHQVTQVQLQYALVSSPTTWIDAGTVSSTVTSAYISGVVAGTAYDFRIRSMRSSGGVSVWVEEDGYTVTVTLSVLSQLALAPGSLVATGLPDGTATIEAEPFTAVVGNLTVSCLTGPFDITGLLQSTLYYVYYIDPTFLGGSITPIATTDKTDFLNKPGYFLIDSIVTPYRPASGGTGGRYSPTDYSDNGQRTAQTPQQAYDGDLTTGALISGIMYPPVNHGDPVAAGGNITYSGFQDYTLIADATVTIVMSTTVGSNSTASIACNLVGSASGNITTITTTTSQATITAIVPSGTNLGSLGVNITVDVLSQTSTRVGIASASVEEIYVQT